MMLVTSKISPFNLENFTPGAYQFNLSGGTATLKLDSDQDGNFSDEGTTITLSNDTDNNEFYKDSGDAAGIVLGTTLSSISNAIYLWEEV